MSRLIDKLMRIRQSEPQPMGFMLGKSAQEKPRIQLIASIRGENRDALTAVPDSVNAVVVEVGKAGDLECLDKVCRSNDKIIAGGWLKASGNGTMKKAFDASCDFLIFPPAAALSLVPKEKPGCILDLDVALSEGLLRTVNDLPVGAVLIFGSDRENTLTFDRLMQVQRVINMVNKPVIMSVSASCSEIEMQALWDAGVSAVVVELEPADEKSLDKIADLARIIEKLEPPASRKKDRMRPILPRIQPEPEQPEDDEEEEE